MAAPNILLAANVAAFEDVEIFFVASKKHCNLQFAQRAQETVVIELARDVGSHIAAEIVFKLNTFRVLVVDRRANYGAFVGAILVGESDATARKSQSRSQESVESQHSAEGCVAVKCALTIFAQHLLIQFAFDDNHVVESEARLSHTFRRSAARVHDERQRSAGGRQKLESHHRVFAASYRYYVSTIRGA